jgi:hypothetical protein
VQASATTTCLLHGGGDLVPDGHSQSDVVYGLATIDQACMACKSLIIRSGPSRIGQIFNKQPIHVQKVTKLLLPVEALCFISKSDRFR